jgi:hypothetical protein
MTGHASSLLTLTNLARLGNKHVRTKYNFIELRNAAVTIHQVCTRECPPYLTEVYGQGALDLIWGGGLMANQWAGEQMWSSTSEEPFELQILLGIEPKIRITTMAGPSMFLAKLTEFFSEIVDSHTIVDPSHLHPQDLRVQALRGDLDAAWPRLLPAGQHIGHAMHSLLHADLRNQQAHLPPFINYYHIWTEFLK